MSAEMIYTLIVGTALIIINRWTISAYKSKEEQRAACDRYISPDTPELFAVCVLLPIAFLSAVILLHIIWR